MSMSYKAERQLVETTRRRLAEVCYRRNAVANTPGHPRRGFAQDRARFNDTGYPYALRLMAKKSRWRRATVRYNNADAKIPCAVKRYRSIQAFNHAMGYGAMGPEFGL